jgi:hypothetical protein
MDAMGEAAATLDQNCLIDLHLHLDGSISVPMARRLATLDGRVLSEDDAALGKRLGVTADCRDLNEYLAKFDFTAELLETREQLSECMYLLQEELAELGYLYAEIRFAPQRHGARGLTQREAVEAVLEGLGRSCFEAGVILCCMRGDDTLEANLETVRLAAEYLGQGVVALDLAGAEALFPTADYADVFALARELAMGRLRSGGLIAEAAAVSLAMVGVDMVSTSLQGTSITELITDVVNRAVEMSTESLDLDGVTAVLETRDSLLVYWPTVYFVVGTGIALCSLFGAWLGVRTSGGRVEPGMIARFDVPLWVAELFALGVVADVLGPRLPQWQREVAMVGANVVMCTRIVLAQQGISVLLWRLRERGAAWPRRAILAFLALWLEMSFALMSIVGIVDVAVNLRHLERNRQDLSLWPARER